MNKQATSRVARFEEAADAERRTMKKGGLLFDVNAAFGKPAFGDTEFPTVADRLQEMDRLGIARALVWNLEAAQNHPLASNQKLLDAIAATPGATGRIFPALAFSDLLLYEHDGVAALIRQFNVQPCRALRFVAGVTRCTLMRAEPVIRALQKLKPFIVLDQDQASVSDVLEFTAVFPEVPVVLTRVMWTAQAAVFDLMRRRSNIMLDISWLHTFGAIEMAVRLFGAERVVFGMGGKAHNGAAVGALARANITEGQRRRIAFGNLDLLTGLESERLVPPAPRPANTYWLRFLSGETLAADVVDAHGHLGPSGGYVLENQREERQMEATFRSMEALGIRTMIVSGLQALMGDPVEGNELIERLLRPHAGRLMGYVVFNPFYADKLTPRFDDWFQGPVFRGFKILCSYWKVPVTDRRFDAMWRYADRHHLPVLSHTWDDEYSRPALFEDLVVRYPQVSFLLAHSGGGDAGRREAEELARGHPNVFLEWCGSFCSTIPWEDTLRRVSPRQVVFGSDAMAHSFDWELARLLSMDVPDAALRPILGGNMRRILARRK